MRHGLHEYLAKKLGDLLRKKRIVVWYDPSSDFSPFLDELVGPRNRPGCQYSISPGGVESWLAEYSGSFFELRKNVEYLVGDEVPVPVLVYIAGVERDAEESVLLEMEVAGEAWQPRLKQTARNVLRPFYTEGVVDDLTPEGVTYQDIARASSEGASAEPPSILKVLFHDVTGGDAILARWLADEGRDAEIEAKDARRELVKLISNRLGIALQDSETLTRLRFLCLRYVLLGELRLDLRCPIPDSLRSVPMPTSQEQEKAVRGISHLLRSDHGDRYPALADRIENELGLTSLSLPPGALGAIDTFRFEERALLDHCAELIAEGRYGEALNIVGQREHSFWLDLDLGRKAQWVACRFMAELGRTAEEVRASLDKAPPDPAAWVDAYTREGDGWYRLDQAQRRLETWIARLEEDADERTLGIVRRAYEDACSRMAERFCQALERAGWSVPGFLLQTQIHPREVAGRPQPVAYFVVDALRFEMGLELTERLPKTAEVTIRPALASLPSITKVGMAAVLPGASTSFAVADEGGKLGAKIEGAFLPNLGSRQNLLKARVPGAVDLGLDELLSLQTSKLAKRIEGAPLILVRSQEIDHAGETGFTFQARQVMDTVIDNLARAIRKLSAQGVEHSVVTADHGHLFFPNDRDDSQKIDAPGGKTVELHRRCWIGRGGATRPGCVRVAAATLGYDSDLDVVFPGGTCVFRAGGDLAYYHGGPTLQEIVIPVLGVRLKTRTEKKPVSSVTVSGSPEAVTNRIFTVAMKLDGLFPATVKPLLLAKGRQVGAAIMAVNADFDATAGIIHLQPGQQATVAFALHGEDAEAVRIVVQDPATDLELYESPKDIPVRLGV